MQFFYHQALKALTKMKKQIKRKIQKGKKKGKKKKVLIILIVIIILVVLLPMLLILFKGKTSRKSEISGFEWIQINNETWKQTNLSCVNSSKLGYLCSRQCLDIHSLNAKNCLNLEDVENVTYNNKDFICAPYGCLFKINQKCEILCII